jgi:hypothetical protein
MRIILSLAALACGSAFAQDGPIITERPGFSTSPQALSAGRFQIESGIEWGLLANRGTAPLALGRYGLGGGTELQLGWSGIGFGEGEASVSGLTLGLKHNLTEGDGARPAVGLIGIVIIPSGDDAADQIDLSGGLLWSSSLGDGFGLFGTASLGTSSAGGDYRGTASNAVGVSYALTERGGLFLEHFVSVTDEEDQAVQVVDAGYTFLLTPDIQLDITGGVSVGAEEAGSFIGGGIAARF